MYTCIHIYKYICIVIKRSDNTPTYKICRVRAPWAAHEQDRITNEIVSTRLVEALFTIKKDDFPSSVRLKA